MANGTRNDGRLVCNAGRLVVCHRPSPITVGARREFISMDAVSVRPVRPETFRPGSKIHGPIPFSTCSFFVNNSPAMARKKRRNRASSDSSDSERDSEVEVSEEASDDEPFHSKAKAGAERRKVREIGPCA